MIQREAAGLIRRYARSFRAVAVVGPRQSGKSTLVKTLFKDKPYISLENPDEREFAETDARGFLARFPKGAIIDEAQRVPHLFNYLQQIIDDADKPGMFILTGSNNFLLQQSITQSLAGRIGYIDLLPLTIGEIKLFGRKKIGLNDRLLKGAYPEIYQKKIDPGIWFPSYIRTYVERDFKQLRNIESTTQFTRFLQLCAGRIGQQLSMNSLCNDCGIDVRTGNAWMSILQSSYIIHLLQPHHKNFRKRVVKSPKLYFIDTGLACSLLGIHTTTELDTTHFRGALFENFVVSEFLKNKFNAAHFSNFYYWRDNKGVEVDLLIDDGKKLTPVEIKSGATFSDDQLRSLRQWNSFSGNKGGYLIYNGKLEMKTKDGIEVMNWEKIGEMKIR
ncbi:MAG TPA: ATP-binding protein [Bacteroidia bacterium]|nr:ATP-binding protein [Bacteroidia bacterium]